MDHHEQKINRITFHHSIFTTTTTIILALVLLSIATSSCTASEKHQHLHHRKKMQHKVFLNAQHVIALQTRGPQPRTVEVLDKLKLSSTEMLQPSQTVLHRCDEVACCAFRQWKSKRCFPTEEPVTLYFQATDFNTGKTRIIEEEFRNHTKCTCQKYDEGP